MSVAADPVEPVVEVEYGDDGETFVTLKNVPKLYLSLIASEAEQLDIIHTRAEYVTIFGNVARHLHLGSNLAPDTRTSGNSVNGSDPRKDKP